MISSAILHLIGHATVSKKSDQARDDWDVGELLPRFAVQTVSRFVTIWTFGDVEVRTDIAATKVGTTIVLLRLEASQKSDA